MENLFDVKGRVIVITGGTGVLGSCISKHLAQQGAKLVILARNESKATSLLEEIKKEGGEALFLQTDVLDKARLEKCKEVMGYEENIYTP